MAQSSLTWFIEAVNTATGKDIADCAVEDIITALQISSLASRESIRKLKVYAQEQRDHPTGGVDDPAPRISEIIRAKILAWQEVILRDQQSDSGVRTCHWAASALWGQILAEGGIETSQMIRRAGREGAQGRVMLSKGPRPNDLLATQGALRKIRDVYRFLDDPEERPVEPAGRTTADWWEAQISLAVGDLYKNRAGEFSSANQIDSVILVTHRAIPPEAYARLEQATRDLGTSQAGQIALVHMSELLRGFMQTDAERESNLRELKDHHLLEGRLLPCKLKGTVELLDQANAVRQPHDDCVSWVNAKVITAPSLLLAIVSEFGSGKSMLCLQLAEFLFSRSESSLNEFYIPLVLPASELDAKQSIWIQISERIRTSFSIDMTPERARCLVRVGILVPILDGLDESRDLSRKGAIRELLWDLSTLTEDNAGGPQSRKGPKIVVTMRKERFPSDAELRDELGISNMHLLRLEDLAKSESDKALNRVFAADKTWENHAAFGLASKPLFLRFIYELTQPYRNLLLSRLKERDDANVRASEMHHLFEILVQQWFKREFIKQKDEGNSEEYYSSRMFVCGIIALKFHEKDDTAKPGEDPLRRRRELIQNIVEVLEDELPFSPDKLMNEAGNSLLLVRSGEKLGFAHRSLWEYFYTRGVLELVRRFLQVNRKKWFLKLWYSFGTTKLPADSTLLPSFVLALSRQVASASFTPVDLVGLLQSSEKGDARKQMLVRHSLCLPRLVPNLISLGCSAVQASPGKPPALVVRDLSVNGDLINPNDLGRCQFENCVIESSAQQQDDLHNKRIFRPEVLSWSDEGSRKRHSDGWISQFKVDKATSTSAAPWSQDYPTMGLAYIPVLGRTVPDAEAMPSFLVSQTPVTNRQYLYFLLNQNKATLQTDLSTPYCEPPESETEWFPDSARSAEEGKLGNAYYLDHWRRWEGLVREHLFLGSGKTDGRTLLAKLFEIAKLFPYAECIENSENSDNKAVKLDKYSLGAVGKEKDWVYNVGIATPVLEAKLRDPARGYGFHQLLANFVFRWLDCPVVYVTWKAAVHCAAFFGGRLLNADEFDYLSWVHYEPASTPPWENAETGRDKPFWTINPQDVVKDWETSDISYPKWPVYCLPSASFEHRQCFLGRYEFEPIWNHPGLVKQWSIHAKEVPPPQDSTSRSPREFKQVLGFGFKTSASECTLEKLKTKSWENPRRCNTDIGFRIVRPFRAGDFNTGNTLTPPSK